ncbi:MAG: hypothetical protein JNM93_11645 [Bacteriovoracaceae bacterium]|nr:hypothetical protein [Bacteriovoracaceae bacterium]
MDLTNNISAEELLKNKSKIKKIFFYRICGTGMGACACLLKEAGYDVEGADMSFAPPMSTYLESTGIPLYKLSEVNDKFLQKYDLIIVGNSVPRVSEQATLIEKCGVAFTSFPTVLGTLVLSNQNVIGVAGTHGKTTTTYLITQMLENLGKKPGYFIGGIIDDRPPSRLGDGSYFAIESDEYDSAYFQKFSKFRQYEIDHLILTSLEFDHADIFNSVEDIEKEFIAAIPKINGSFVLNNDYPSCLKLYEQFSKTKKVPWYLYGNTSPLGPKIVTENQEGTIFELNFEGKPVSFKTNLIGKHNVLNVTACILFCLNEGFSIKQVQAAVKKLNMVKRRQEVKGKYKGAIVVDDFAHHPRAVSVTIDSIKTKFPDKKIFVVLEPMSATARSNVFQDEFAESLLLANKVIIAKPSIATTAKDKKDLDTIKIVEMLKTKKIPSANVDNLNQLRLMIDQMISTDDVLLILSNRTCLGLWESNFINEIH